MSSKFPNSLERSASSPYFNQGELQANASTSMSSFLNPVESKTQQQGAEFFLNKRSADQNVDRNNNSFGTKKIKLTHESISAQLSEMSLSEETSAKDSVNLHNPSNKDSFPHHCLPSLLEEWSVIVDDLNKLESSWPIFQNTQAPRPLFYGNYTEEQKSQFKQALNHLVSNSELKILEISPGEGLGNFLEMRELSKELKASTELIQQATTLAGLVDGVKKGINRFFDPDFSSVAPQVFEYFLGFFSEEHLQQIKQACKCSDTQNDSLQGFITTLFVTKNKSKRLVFNALAAALNEIAKGSTDILNGSGSLAAQKIRNFNILIDILNDLLKPYDDHMLNNNRLKEEHEAKEAFDKQQQEELSFQPKQEKLFQILEKFFENKEDLQAKFFELCQFNKGTLNELFAEKFKLKSKAEFLKGLREIRDQVTKTIDNLVKEARDQTLPTDKMTLSNWRIERLKMLHILQTLEREIGFITDTKQIPYRKGSWSFRAFYPSIKKLNCETFRKFFSILNTLSGHKQIDLKENLQVDKYCSYIGQLREHITDELLLKAIRSVKEEYQAQCGFICGSLLKAMPSTFTDHSETTSVSNLQRALLDLDRRICKELDSGEFENNKSFSFSSFSLAVTLGMLVKGLKADKKQRMIDLMGFKGVSEDGLYNKITNSLDHLSKTSGSGYAKEYGVFKSAQALAHTPDKELGKEYCKFLKNQFDAEIFVTDTIRPVVDEWVNKKTEGKIQKIIPADDVKLAVVNAIYFNFKWTNIFSDEQLKDFTTADGNVHKVLMMRSLPGNEQKLFAVKTWETSEFEMVSIPYKSPDSTQLRENILFMPKKAEDFSRLEALLTPEFIQMARQVMQQEAVYLEFPKTKLESSIDLYKPLSKLEFPIKSNDLDKSILPFGGITGVIQKTAVNNGKEGTEVAIVTAAYNNKCLSEPPKPLPPRRLRIDKAFISFIFEGDTPLLHSRFSDKTCLVKE